MEIKNDKIIFSSRQEIENNYEKMPMSYLGNRSDIFKYNNDEIMKVLEKPASANQKNTIEEFHDYNPKYFSVPELDVFINEELYGYTMKYLEGVPIQRIPKDLPLDMIFNAFDIKLENELYKLAINRMILWDLNREHILFNLKKLQYSFIDIDGYVKDKEISQDGVYFSNAKEILNIMIIDGLFGSGLYSENLILLARQLLEKGLTIKEILYYIKTNAEKRIGQQLTTIHDIKVCKALKKF